MPDPAVIDHIVESLDRRMAWIDQQQLPPALGVPAGPARTAADAARAARHDKLFKQAIRTLYVTGRFLDLPDEIKTHPAVQDRLAAAMPEMDDAVLGMTDLLESLGPEDHRAIQATLKRRPDIGEHLAHLLEDPAREDGIPFKRRMSVRASTIDLASRMRAQPPALTIDPYVRRVRKIEAHPHTPQELARVMAARMGEEAFWQHQDRLADLSRRWERSLAQAHPPAPPPTRPPLNTLPGVQPAVPPPPRQSTGHSILGTGGRIMGFGAISVGIGLLFAGLYSVTNVEVFGVLGLVMGVTVGPILLVIGLLVVIVGGLTVATE